VEHRRLGASGLNISIVGFGAWPIAGEANATGNLGPADDDESIAAIHRSLELGVNWIDTAPGYGCGHSEDVIGRALRGMRDPPYVFTKCGFVWGEDRKMRLSLEAASIRAEIEQSLGRLGVEAVDLYQIHWIEPEVDPDIEQAWTTLAELRREGKVRHIGVSNFDVPQIRRAQAIAAVETLQPPYSLLERSAETEILPFCGAQDIGVIVYSPMQSGLLTGSMTAQRVASLPSSDARLFDPNFVEPRLSQNLAVADALRRIADRLGRPCGELAIAWTLAHAAVTGAIVGFRRPSQVDGILAGTSLQLTPDELVEVTALVS
jgi:aryl-alcohol dehydrogenase-like predicted oxidoreductase